MTPQPPAPTMPQVRTLPGTWAVSRYMDILRAHLPELRERYGVTYLGVFGSFVRNEQRLDSDLDMLIEFDDRPLTLFHIIGLENELSDLLGVKVDLVERDCLKPTIGHRILTEVVPV